jgi:transcriptional regulator with XRE-family HTH domain
MPKPSEVFRARLREVRRLKGWTQADLASALAAAGMNLGEPAITRMERGTRGLSLDEAVAIAAVLGVSPLHMIVPLDDDSAQIAPGRTVSTADARAWIRGLTPLIQADEQLFYALTPASEADWIPLVPGAWRFEDPETFAATRAKWEREIFRSAISRLAEPQPGDLDAQDLPPRSR